MTTMPPRNLEGEPLTPSQSLSIRNAATRADIMVELTRLAVHFPTSLSPEEQALRLSEFCHDLKGKTLEEIRYGCRRYRQNPENRFFPTPGQLLEACRNPFEAPRGRTYDPLDDLPPALPADVAQKLIEKTRAKYDFKPAGQEPSIEELKRQARERPTIQPVPIPMTQERRAELLHHIKQNLLFKYGENAGKYIAELPD